MRPLEYYQELLSNGKIKPNPEQLRVVEYLEQLYFRLFAHSQSSISQRFSKWLNRPSVKGIYLWGDVGSGKSMLVDIFSHCCPANTVLRLHYHAFIQQIRQRLTALQGQKNPLDLIAKEYSQHYKIILLDEFMVNDAANAMTLAGLLSAFIKRHLVFITTSNIEPEQLNQAAALKEQFQPTIDLLKQHHEIIHLHTGLDFRSVITDESSYYFWPINQQSWQRLDKLFKELAYNNVIEDGNININERSIKLIKRCGGVIWFDCKTICNIPRSQEDYLALAKNFHTFIISGLTVIAPDETNLARSFVQLIDVLYDNHVKLIIQADKPIEQIYPQGRLVNEFQRAISRIKQMQSKAWHELSS